MNQQLQSIGMNFSEFKYRIMKRGNGITKVIDGLKRVLGFDLGSIIENRCDVVGLMPNGKLHSFSKDAINSEKASLRVFESIRSKYIEKVKRFDTASNGILLQYKGFKTVWYRAHLLMTEMNEKKIISISSVSKSDSVTAAVVRRFYNKYPERFKKIYKNYYSTPLNVADAFFAELLSKVIESLEKQRQPRDEPEPGDYVSEAILQAPEFSDPELVGYALALRKKMLEYLLRFGVAADMLSSSLLMSKFQQMSSRVSGIVDESKRLRQNNVELARDNAELRLKLLATDDISLLQRTIELRKLIKKKEKAEAEYSDLKAFHRSGSKAHRRLMELYETRDRALDEAKTARESLRKERVLAKQKDNELRRLKKKLRTLERDRR